MSKFHNQFRGLGSDRKFKVAVESIKLTTGFGDIDQNVYFLNWRPEKSRTLGVDQKLLIF